MTPLRPCTAAAGRWRTGRSRAPRLAFDVPRERRRVTVELDLRPRGRGVLDLGCRGPGGFRGWSGGARDASSSPADWATPGYLPGEPVEPGDVAGAAAGCTGSRRGASTTRCGVTARRPAAAGCPQHRRAEPAAPAGATGPRRAGDSARASTGCAGSPATSTRTRCTRDGVLPFGSSPRWPASRGLDFLAVTDHNTASHHAELPAAGRPATASCSSPGRRSRATSATRTSSATSAGSTSGARRDVGPAGRAPGRRAVDQPPARRRLRLAAAARPPDPGGRGVALRRGRPPTWGAPLAWWLAWRPDDRRPSAAATSTARSRRAPGDPRRRGCSPRATTSSGPSAPGGPRSARRSTGPSSSATVTRSSPSTRRGCSSRDRAGRAAGCLVTVSACRRGPVPCWLEDDARVVHALCG